MLISIRSAPAIASALLLAVVMPACGDNDGPTNISGDETDLASGEGSDHGKVLGAQFAQEAAGDDATRIGQICALMIAVDTGEVALAALALDP